jgi:hypothetical protein
MIFFLGETIGVVLVALSFILMATLVTTLLAWIRTARVARFARTHGYTFSKGPDNPSQEPFSSRASTRTLFWWSTQIKYARNVVRGEAGGVAFVYFEQSVELQNGIIAGTRGSDIYSRSIIAGKVMPGFNLQPDQDSDDDVKVKQDGAWWYIIWKGKRPVPVRKLEYFFTVAAGTIERGLAAQHNRA